MTSRRCTIKRPVLIVAGILLALAGCGETKAPGASSPDDNGAGDSSTLRIASEEYPETHAAIEAFEKEHPDIHVEFEPGSPSFEDGSVQTLLRSGKAPDVILVNSGPGRVGLLADAHLIMNLDDLYASKGLAGRFRPDVLDQMKAGNAEGSYFEVVQGLGSFEIYYNKSVFDEKGLTPPQTFDQFLGLCGPLSDGDKAPIALGVRDNYAGGWLFGMLLQSAAGAKAMGDVLFGDAPINTPEFVHAAEMLKQLADDGCINAQEAAALDNEQASAAFFGGQAPMTPAYQGVMVEKEASGADLSDYSSFPMPTAVAGGANVPTSGFDQSWVVSANTKAKTAAYEWLDFVSSEDYANIATEHHALFVPAIITQGVKLDPWVQHAADSIDQGSGYNPSVYLDAGPKDAYYAAVQGILSGSMSPQEAMDSIESALEDDRK